MTIIDWLLSLQGWDRVAVALVGGPLFVMWATFPIFLAKHVERIANALERIANKK